MNETFRGFEPANTTPVPDVLFDELLPYLNEAQLKVLLYIIRRTLGFKKSTDAISLKQFRYGIVTKDKKILDRGCGLKNMTTISKALQDLEKMQCIERDKKDTAAGDPETTVYRIRFRGTTPNVLPTTPNVEGVLRQTYGGTTPNVEGVLRQTYPQETVLQLDSNQETVLQETERANAPDAIASTHTQLPQKEVSVVSTQEETPPQKPVKPQQKKPVTPKVIAPSKPVVTLDTPEQIAFWDRWCKVWFNAEMPPTLNDTAKTHIVKLAAVDRLKTDEAINSLVTFAKKELEANTGVKKKTIALGNLVGSYSRWVQTQQEQATTPPPAKVVMDHDAACKLAHEIIEQGKRTGYPIQALAGQSVNNPDVWVVNVKWENRFNIVLRPIRSPKHWEERFHDMHESLTAITPNMYAAGVR